MNVTLRPWSLSDAPALAGILDNKAVQDQLRDGLPCPYTVSDAKDYITFMLHADPGTTRAYAIDVGGRAAGNMTAVRESPHARSAEIGFYVAEPYWGHGYGTSAIRQLAVLLFETTDLLRLFAEVFSTNIASCRALEKAGFTCEATLRRHAVKNGRAMDVNIYALTRPQGSLGSAGPAAGATGHEKP